ncbi:MAG: hypothetical protein EOO69_05230 [Moraxellaceae bacterium]|nr:MAG: hypothetical protein EOO69_05230 [Moraxellaceae bacterium]
MVNNKIDLLTTSQTIDESATPLNLRRWFKNFMYMPWQTQQCFNADVQAQISTAVARAEQSHAGEIQVIIEGHLPLDIALRGSTAMRAQQLFAEYGVWDTAYNSGVLLYINLCERAVEIVADRGIDCFVDDAHWNTICANMTALLRQKQYATGVICGIEQVGQVLEQYYDQQIKDFGNELSNSAILL